MKPARFVYHSPATVDETVSLLAELGADAKLLAGGQSLIPILNMRLSSPAHLVDINGVAGLDTVDVNGDVRVGALARHARVEADPGVRAACPVLPEALRLVAHPAIRNRGTVCGALAHADPASELPGVLMLLGGSVEVVRSGAAPRSIAAADFFVGPMESALGADELVVAARFPVPPAGTGSAFLEVSRRHGDYALCGVGAVVQVVDGTVTSARCAYISCNPVPRVLELTSAVAGQPAAALDVAAACALAGDFVDPDADIHATVAYRRQLAATLTGRALTLAAGRAGRAHDR